MAYSTYKKIRKQYPTIVIKIGGRPTTDLDCMLSLADDIIELQKAGIRVAVVHGGGARVTTLSERLGVTARFTDGVRITGHQDMLIADQVLSGEMNTELVRLFHNRGTQAVGLTGCDAGLCTAQPLAEHTGQVSSLQPRVLRVLWKAGMLPIIASVSQDTHGTPMNINADEFARGIAAGLSAAALVYISDIPGILIRGSVVTHLTPPEIEKAILEDEIRDGMIAKTRAATAGLQQGIGTVCIGDYAVAGNLVSLLTGKRGTHIGTF